MSKNVKRSNEDGRVWALSRELVTLEYALYGVQAAVGSLSESDPDSEQSRHLAEGVDAMVSLVALRLRDVGRVVRGELDPVLLFCAHNATSLDLEENVDELNRGVDIIFGARLK